MSLRCLVRGFAFSDALRRLAHARDTAHGPMPDAVHLRAEDRLDGVLALGAGDAAALVELTIPAEVEEEGALVLPYRRCLELVAGFRGDKAVDGPLALDGGLYAPLVAPPWPGEGPMLHAPAGLLVALVEGVGACLSNDESRPHLAALHLVHELATVDGAPRHVLRAEATDGHRAARMVVDAASVLGEMGELLLPARFAAELGRLPRPHVSYTGKGIQPHTAALAWRRVVPTPEAMARGGPESHDGGPVWCSFRGELLHGRLEAGSFPALRHVIPAYEAQAGGYTFDRAAALTLVKAGLKAAALGAGLVLRCEGSELTLATDGGSKPCGKLPVGVRGVPCKVLGVDGAYLADALAACKPAERQAPGRDTVELRTGAHPLDPLTLGSPLRPELEWACMPMRV